MKDMEKLTEKEKKLEVLSEKYKTSRSRRRLKSESRGSGLGKQAENNGDENDEADVADEAEEYDEDDEDEDEDDTGNSPDSGEMKKLKQIVQQYLRTDEKKRWDIENKLSDVHDKYERWRQIAFRIHVYEVHCSAPKIQQSCDASLREIVKKHKCDLPAVVGRFHDAKRVALANQFDNIHTYHEVNQEG